MSSFRLAFLGLPLAALLLADDGHEIAFAASCRVDAPGRRRLARTLGAGRVLARGEATDRAIFDRVKAARPDLVVSWFWTSKLPRDVLVAAPLGAIGVHPSLLPRHRGPDPYFAAIDAGDLVTGVTAHRLEVEYDTGAILGQRTLAIDPSWSAWKLARALDRPSLALLRETVARFARGEPIAEVAQDEAQATSADAPDDDACALEFSWPVARLLRRVRALSPAPGAFFEIGDALVVVTEARAFEACPRALVPGEAAVVDGAPIVRAADGAVELVRGEIDGERAERVEFASLFARSRGMVLG